MLCPRRIVSFAPRNGCTRSHATSLTCVGFTQYSDTPPTPAPPRGGATALSLPACPSLASERSCSPVATYCHRTPSTPWPSAHTRNRLCTSATSRALQPHPPPSPFSAKAFPLRGGGFSCASTACIAKICSAGDASALTHGLGVHRDGKGRATPLALRSPNTEAHPKWRTGNASPTTHHPHERRFSREDVRVPSGLDATQVSGRLLRRSPQRPRGMRAPKRGGVCVHSPQRVGRGGRTGRTATALC